MNEKLKAISDKAIADFQSLIQENEKLLLESWSSAEQEAQDNETKPKFKFNLGVTLDLDKDSMACDLTFGVRYKRTVETSIPDPSQPEFVEISTPGMEPVRMTGQKFKDLPDKIQKMARNLPRE